MSLYLYKYHEDCGRSGSLDGIFIVDERGKSCIDALMESQTLVYFGEVLGKHSDVTCHYEPGSLTPEDIPQGDVSTVLRVIGKPIDPDGKPWCTISGFNPLDYVDAEGIAFDGEGWTYGAFLALCKGDA